MKSSFEKDPVNCANKAYLSICDASKGPSHVMANKCFNDDFIQDFEKDILQDDEDMQNIDLCKLQLLDALKTYKEGNTNYGSQFKLFHRTSKTKNPTTLKVKTPSPLKKTPSPLKVKTPLPLKVKTPSPLKVNPSPVVSSPTSPMLPFSFRRMNASPIEEDWRSHPPRGTEGSEYELTRDHSYMRFGSPKDKIISSAMAVARPKTAKIASSKIAPPPKFAQPKIAVRMNKTANMRFLNMINNIKETIRKQIIKIKGGKRRRSTRKYKKTLKIHRKK